MNELNTYLSTQVQWSASTSKQVSAQLTKYSPYLADPVALWAASSALAPYTRSVLFKRVSHYHSWLLSKGFVKENTFHTFLKTNRKLSTSQTYQPRLPTTTYQEAAAAIATIEDVEIREKALQLLNGGLRFAESLTLKDGYVTGKGGKERRAYIGEVAFNRSYNDLRFALAPLGLKPHTLRKIMATELVKRGVSVFDLTKVMGWSSVQTAMSYVGNMPQDELNKIFDSIKALKEETHETKQIPGEVRKTG